MVEPIAYLNGRYIAASQATLHVFDLGIVGGMSVTEMARTFRHKPFRLDEHLTRLAASLDAVGFQTGRTSDDWKLICERIIAENTRQIPADHDLGLILFVTAGPNVTYIGRAAGAAPLKPTVCVHTFPLPFELWADSFQNGVHLVAVSAQSIPDQVIDCRIKHRSRMHWHLAAREARQIDPHAVAILSDGSGQLTETASGNLCVVDGTTIVTPPAHVLKGISVAYVSRIASSLGFSVLHGPVTSDNLASADEAFLTSTPYCMLPITKFNNQAIGTGKPGPVYRQLINAWSNNVDRDIIGQMVQGAADRQRAAQVTVTSPDDEM